ncbi:hypothetical protein [Magnetospirillum sp. 15-1]|uniref:hypothetical protein n=1 Tax=Magnetospirillum sp. 15-1 TaxID=1979370 RepID=UPI001144C035|nr:hypothetical protein [Magnetospirillum sp. 15-1]
MTMHRFCKRAMLVLMFFLSSAAAASGPTYEETVDFIKKKIDNNNYKGDYGSAWRESFNEISRCTFEIRSYVYYPGREESGDLTSYVVDFKDLDPGRTSIGSVEGNPPWVTTITKENKESIKRTSYDRPSESDFSKKYASMKDRPGNRRYVDDVRLYSLNSPREENAGRIKNAVNHLIGMCGGSAELF